MTDSASECDCLNTLADFLPAFLFYPTLICQPSFNYYSQAKNRISSSYSSENFSGWEGSGHTPRPIQKRKFSPLAGKFYKAVDDPLGIPGFKGVPPLKFPAQRLPPLDADAGRSCPTTLTNLRRLDARCWRTATTGIWLDPDAFPVFSEAPKAIN